MRLDHLTGLGNRAYFDEAIGRAVEQHSREPHGLVLVLLDLDRFKQVNDTWGHPVGDLVLSRFAQLLQGCIRGTDQAFRLGGDEFALLLQPADPEAWRPVWLRLQHVLHSHKELSAFSVGCSLGAASWQSGMDVQRLYETADTHLYARKKAGAPACPNRASPSLPAPCHSAMSIRILGTGAATPRHPLFWRQKSVADKEPGHQCHLFTVVEDGNAPPLPGGHPYSCSSFLSRRLPTRPTGFSMTPGRPENAPRAARPPRCPQPFAIRSPEPELPEPVRQGERLFHPDGQHLLTGARSGATR